VVRVGAVIVKIKELVDKIRKMINFGIDGPDSIGMLGTNAKMREFHAAVGLAVLDDIEHIQSQRKDIWKQYEKVLAPKYQLQKRHTKANNNHAYFPLLLESEQAVLDAVTNLAENGIQARRYFYPSLDRVALFDSENLCSVSYDIASRIVCLPIWPGLESKQFSFIVKTLEGEVVQ
jgi:dTDP-4-amino-4,6-dideoxygalactose transaminase